MRDGKPFEIEVDPTGLLLGRIKVDSNENPIVTARFAVTKQIWIIDRMEVERTVILEGGIVAADSVDLRNQRGETVTSKAVPMSNFVLLAIEILFAPRLRRSIFAKLKGRPIDTIARPKRRGKNETLHKSWPAAALKPSMKDVRSVRAEVWMEEIRHWRLRNLLKILLQLVF